jgi:electron transport complex protein RnfG
MKDTIKMTAALVIFATIACVGLAFVYQGTQPVIAQRQKADMDAALRELFPGAGQFDEIEGGLTAQSPAIRFTGAYVAVDSGAFSGAAIQAVANGFSNDITALVGVDVEGKITGVKILTNTDTPGLGANAGKENYYVGNKAEKVTFYGQFRGMTARDTIAVEKDGGPVAAITAATITSRAVALLVSEAAKAGYAWLSQGGN